jgi:IS605 OrfB family transposase
MPASVNFDHRTYSLKGAAFSIFTAQGRARVEFACGPVQRALLATGIPKEARLIIRKGRWYLNLVFDLPDPVPLSGQRAMGLDVGENNLAATSTGKVFGGGKLRHDRDRYLASRRRLQSNGSRASKRKLKAISGREQRHVRHVNHVTSKAIVAQALQAGASILRMEDLTHIRARIKAGNRVRARLHRWAFRQLQDLVRYKVDILEFTQGMSRERDRLIHQYFGIDDDIVWESVELDVRPILASIRLLLVKLPPTPPA